MEIIEKEILKLFLENEKLKFSHIEKNLKLRSNKISYHLQKLVKKKILEKEGNLYFLSHNSLKLMPYLSNQTSPLPVILIHIGNNKSCFLIKRDKRPFQNKLALPGGRIFIGESIKQATKRIMKEKYKIKGALIKINSVSLEQVKSQSKKIHSFFLIFVSASTKDKVNLISIEKNKTKIISSDFKLLKEDLNKFALIKQISTIN